MSIEMNPALTEKFLEPFNTLFGGGEIWLYEGEKPSVDNEDWNTFGTYLGYITLPEVPFSATSTGSFVKNGEWIGYRNNSTGTLNWFRMVDSTFDTYWIDGDITLTGGGGELQVPNLTLPTNTQILVETATFQFTY